METIQEIKIPILCQSCDYPLAPNGLHEVDSILLCTICRDCTQCHQMISSMELSLIIRNKLPHMHVKHMLEQFPFDELFSICIKDIEFLNVMRFLNIADMSNSEDTQLKMVEHYESMIWTSLTTNEERFRHMRMLETRYKLAYTAVKSLGELPPVPERLSRNKIAKEVNDKHSAEFKTKVKDKEFEELSKIPYGKAMLKFRKQMRSMNLSDDIIAKRWNAMNPDMPWILPPTKIEE